MCATGGLPTSAAYRGRSILRATGWVLALWAILYAASRSLTASEPAPFIATNARPLASSAVNPLRWRAPKSDVSYERAAETFDDRHDESFFPTAPIRSSVQVATHKQPVARTGGWNISRAGAPARFVQNDLLQDPLGDGVAQPPEDESELPRPRIDPPMILRPSDNALRQPPPPPEPEMPDRNDQRSQSDMEGRDLPAPLRDEPSISRPSLKRKPGCEDRVLSGSSRTFACSQPEGLKCLPDNFLDISPRLANLRILSEISRRADNNNDNIEDILERILGDSEADQPPASELRERLKNDSRIWTRPRNADRTEWPTPRKTAILVDLDAESVRIAETEVREALSRDGLRIGVESPTGRRYTVRRADLIATDEAFVRNFEERTYRSRSGRDVARGYVGPLKDGRVTIVDANDQPRGQVALVDLAGEDLNVVAQFYRLPAECLVQQYDAQVRCWTPSTLCYTASALAHKPLYFEQPQVERYGHSLGPVFQPLYSGGKFFVDFAWLPYKMAINPPGECQYVLGHYRPGSCAPYMIPPIPLSVRGAIAQAGVIVGGIYIIP